MPFAFVCDGICNDNILDCCHIREQMIVLKNKGHKLLSQLAVSDGLNIGSVDFYASLRWRVKTT